MRRIPQPFLKWIIPAGCLLSLFGQHARAQEYTYFNYNEQNILPSSEVYQIMQDRSGFIWFATDNGVVKFDGADFTTFNKSNGLADAVVFGIHEDGDGNLYFRTFSGAVSKYAHNEMKPYPYNDKIKSIIGNSIISALEVDSIGTLHFATSATYGKIVSISKDGKVSVVNYPPPALFGRHINHKFLIGRSGIMGSIQNVSIDDKKFKIQRHDSLENSGVLGYAFWNKKLYVTKDRYLYEYDENSIKLVRSFKNSIVSISVDRSNHLWIGQMNGGVERFTDATFQSSFKIALFQKQSVTTVLEDNEGGFWFSTLERGVFYVPTFEIENYPYPPDSKINAVSANENLVFLGFSSGKLMAIDVVSRKEAWSYDLQFPIMSIFYDQSKKEIWVSSNSNVKVLTDHGNLLRRTDEIKSVKKFFRFPDNKIGATNSNGIYKVDMSGTLRLEKSASFWLRNSLLTNEGIYLAGVTGLNKTDFKFSSIVPIKEFENLKVSGIELLPNKEILVASIGNGIRIISNGTPMLPRKNEFLFENAYQVWIDSSVWVATEKGLFTTPTIGFTGNHETHYCFIDKGTGLLSNKVNFIWRFENETWCFLSDGYSVLKNSKMKFANKTLKNYVKNISINHINVTDTVFYDLPHDKNNIRLSLGFISFHNRNITLRHRIKDSNEDWNYTKAASIDYFSLTPGRYAFDIEYSSDYTTWNRINFPHSFEIHPTWWESLYFKLVIVLLMASASYFFFRVRYNRKLLRLEMQSKLRSEKERIARDLHDNIGSKLVSLSLGLDSMTKSNSTNKATSDLLIENVNSTVTELRDTIWVIQKEDITLSEFIDKLDNLVWRLRQQHENKEFQLFVDPIHGFENNKFSPLTAINLFRIIQEVIANSQKHSQATVIRIRLGLDKLNPTIKIVVEDNGVGFDLEKVLQNGHYGLGNMKLRSVEIGARINIQTEPGKGTTVKVEVGLNSKQAK